MTDLTLSIQIEDMKIKDSDQILAFTRKDSTISMYGTTTTVNIGFKGNEIP